MNDTSSGNPRKGTVKITKASRALQKKAGIGDISPELIRKAEKVLSDSTEDFTPLALELLDKLRHTLDRIKASNLDSPRPSADFGRPDHAAKSQRQDVQIRPDYNPRRHHARLP